MKKQKRKFGYNTRKKSDASTTNAVNVICSKQLKKEYGLSNDEIKFLSALEIFEKHEFLPMRVNGVMNGKKVIAPPISVAVFDFYYGAKRLKNDGVLAILGMFNSAYYSSEIEMQMSLSKSIFKKVSPELYQLCF